MNRILTLVLTLLAFSTFSQELKIEKGRFYKGESQVKVAEFVEQMSTNSEAYEMALKAKSSYGTSNVLGFIGGFMVGWPLGTAIAGGDPNWAIAGGGAAILAVAIPIQSSAVKKLKSAANMYNTNQTSSSSARLDINLKSGGLGLVYTF